MMRNLKTLASGIDVGVAVTFATDHDHHKAVKVTQRSQVAHHRDAGRKRYEGVGNDISTS